MMKALQINKLTVVHKLLIAIASISIFVMLTKLFNVAVYKTIIEQFALFSDFTIFKYRIWQFVTYSFLHADIMHLVLNMVMLYLFSQLFFTFFNEKQLLKAYFLGGIAAGVFYFVISNIFGLKSFVVGASGAIMAVFFTVVGYNSKMRVTIIIFGNIAIYYIALAFIAFDVVQLFFNNAGGHLAHIGGSIFGFCYGKYLGGFLWTNKQPAKKKSPLRTVHKVNQDQRKSAQNDVQKQIDIILDKISKSGYESLTQEEKEFLFKQK